MNKQAKIDFIINFSYYSLIFFLAVVFSGLIFKYLFPFVIAATVAYLMQKPAKKISQKIRLKQGITAALLSALFYLLIVFLLGFFAYKAIYYLIIFSESFVTKLPTFLTNLKTPKIFTNLPTEILEIFNSVLPNMINNIISRFTNYISSLAGKFAKGMPSFLLSSIVALVATCYIAKDFEKLCAFLKGIFGKKIYTNVVKIKNIVSQNVFKIAKGYLILSAITYLEIMVGLFILKVKYAPVIALVISIVDLLPVLGAGTVLLPWAIYQIIFDKTLFGVGIAVLYLITILVRNFLEPKVISKQIGIYPLFTLLSMFIGLKLIGFAGIFIFPITLIVVIKYYKSEIYS